MISTGSRVGLSGLARAQIVGNKMVDLLQPSQNIVHQALQRLVAFDLTAQEWM